jgi:prepilin-type N-terminal cleavage/methylation domain-containing protein
VVPHAPYPLGRQGFTATELMLVIAIIGVLAVVSITGAANSAGDVNTPAT